MKLIPNKPHTWNTCSTHILYMLQTGIIHTLRTYPYVTYAPEIPHTYCKHAPHILHTCPTHDLHMPHTCPTHAPPPLDLARESQMLKEKGSAIGGVAGSRDANPRRQQAVILLTLTRPQICSRLKEPTH